MRGRDWREGDPLFSILREKLCLLRSSGVPSSFYVFTLSFLKVFPLSIQSKVAHHCIYTQAKEKRKKLKTNSFLSRLYPLLSHSHHFCSYPRGCFLLTQLLAVMHSAESVGILLLKEWNKRLDDKFPCSTITHLPLNYT